MCHQNCTEKREPGTQRRLTELQTIYQSMQRILFSSSHLVETLEPMWFKYQKAQRYLLNKTFPQEKRPQELFILFLNGEGQGQGEFYFLDENGEYMEESLTIEMGDFLEQWEVGETLCCYNEKNDVSSLQHLPQKMLDRIPRMDNCILFINENILILGLNFPQSVDSFWGEILKGISIQLLLYRTIFLQTQEIREAFIYTSSALARAAEAKDAETGYHIHRVSRYSVALAKKLSFQQQELDEIAYSSKMHDVGKINIGHNILLKPGPLTREEFMEMENHTVYGVLILGDSPYLEMARSIALSHHERWDGTGYPYYSKGREIPIEACIVSIADIYDALRSHRPYKPPFDHDTSCCIILEGDGRVEPHHFHPDVLQAFRELTETFAQIYEELS